MKQAYGGAFMMILYLIILFVVVAFAAIGLVIAKGYRAKNQLVTYIEQYQGCEVEITSDYDTLDECKLRGDNNNLIETYLNSVGYDTDLYSVNVIKSDKCDTCYYYEVVLNVGWSLPFINSDNAGIIGAKASKGTSGTFTIRGKTDIIRE